MGSFFKKREGSPPKVEHGGPPSLSKEKQSRVEVNLADLPSDPGLRLPISSFPLMEREKIVRHYLQRGPTQPHHHNFPLTKSGKQNRHFNPIWLQQYSSWLEYSVSKDAAFCLHCYLFKQSHPGSDAFSSIGFNNLKRSEKIGDQVGKT